MGCGASKGKAEGEGSQSDDIEFKDTGCNSMDVFFNRAKEVLDAVKDLTGPLAEQKEKFFESTGFYEVPGAGKDFLTYIHSGQSCCSRYVRVFCRISQRKPRFIIFSRARSML